MGNIVIQWTTKFWAHRYRWVFVGIALFTVIYIPVVPYRLECYDGNFNQVKGALNYQFRKELLIWFQNYQVDYTWISGTELLEPVNRRKMSIPFQAMGWDDGIILIRISDRLDLDGGSWVANAQNHAIRTLIDERWDALPQSMQDSIKTAVPNRATGDYNYSDCNLVRAVAVAKQPGEAESVK